MQEIIQAEIVDITDDGRSIAKRNGTVYFIEGGVVGDIVHLHVTAQKQNYYEAEIVNTVASSPYKVSSECECSKKCGGCSLRECSYDGQIAIKEKLLTEKIKRALHKDNFKIDKVIRSDKVNFYRNTVQLKCAVQNGKLQLGFFARNSHIIVTAQRCFLLPEIMQKAVDTLKASFQNLNDILHFDSMNEIILRTNNTEDALQLIFVYQNFPQKNMCAEANLHNWIKIIESVMSNLNIVSFYAQDVSGNMQLLFGEKFLHTKLCGVKFQLSPNSFFQVNTKQAEKLFDEVLTQLSPESDDFVFDLFCGVGSISLIVAPHVKKVVGVEIVKDAIQNAAANARLNENTNAEFILGNVEKIFTDDFISERKNAATKIIVDPPRAGISKKVLDKIIATRASKIIYVSCNPATLARDLKILTGGGYALTHTTMLDMFPHTSHIETVALLSKLDVDKHIDVKIKLDELDSTSAKSKMTYAKSRNIYWKNLI